VTVAQPAAPCEHFEGLGHVRPRTRGCEECLALRESWTELRVCLTCGHVGCCEDSPHAHALAHYQASGHPVIASRQAGETWSWCYEHRRYFDPMPDAVRPRATGLAGALQRLFARRK